MWVLDNLHNSSATKVKDFRAGKFSKPNYYHDWFPNRMFNLIASLQILIDFQKLRCAGCGMPLFILGSPDAGYHFSNYIVLLQE